MNLTNFLKKGFVSLIIIILGLAMLLIFGFNKGFDFTGGTVLTVNATTNKDSEAINKINNVIKSADGVKLYSITVGEVGDETVLTVKYLPTKDVAETDARVLTQMFSAFNYDKTDIVQKNYILQTTNVAGAYNNAIFYNALIGTLVLLIATAVYVFARMGLASAFVTTASGILDIGVLLSIFAILRLEVSAFTGIAILGVAVLSVLFNYLTIHKLCTNANDENYKKYSNKQLADVSITEQFKPSIVYIFSTFVALMLGAIITVGSASSSLFALALGTLGTIITALYITPSLWTISYKHKIKRSKAGMPETETE